MATLIECPTCKKQVSSNADACPGCGEILRKNKCRSIKGGFISLAVGFALFFFWIYLGALLKMPSMPMISLGVFSIICGLAGACVCFTAPSK